MTPGFHDLKDLVVLRSYGTLKVKVISWLSVFPAFLTPVLRQISFQSHWLLFSHASAEVRGENMKERNFASTRSRTHNHRVMSLDTLTTEPPGRGDPKERELLKTYWENAGNQHFLLFPCFLSS